MCGVYLNRGRFISGIAFLLSIGVLFNTEKLLLLLGYEERLSKITG